MPVQSSETAKRRAQPGHYSGRASATLLLSERTSIFIDAPPVLTLRRR